MNITYITLLQVIESFAAQHMEVRRFKSDFLEQLGNFGTEGSSYPILYATSNAATFNGEMYSDYTQHSLTFYCLDLIQEDRANVNNLLNTTQLILNDLHLYFKNGEIPGIELVGASQVSPLNNYLLDYAVGWQMTMTFDVNVHTVCEIPFANNPSFPVEGCDISYEQFKGPQGYQGPIGLPGATSGIVGPQGPTGNVGINGTQGFQGIEGSRGFQGSIGNQGYAGPQGIAGSNGTNGINGTQGVQGSAGTNGTNGINGAQGFQGSQGVKGDIGTQGFQGSAGTNGTNGINGTQGFQGPQGIAGVNGYSTSLQLYKAKTTITTGNPDNGYVIWNNSTQIGATSISISHLTDDNIDIDIILSFLAVGQSLYLQDRNNSADYQKWIINGTPTQTVGVSNYWTVPVSLINSGGVGTTNFAGNEALYLGIFSGVDGAQGAQGLQGPQGFQGIMGVTGTNGATGVQGSTGFQGAQGNTGSASTVAGPQGYQGLVGPQGAGSTGGATLTGAYTVFLYNTFV